MLYILHIYATYIYYNIYSDVLEVIKKHLLSIIYLLNVIINAHSFVQSQIKTESQRRSDVLQSEIKHSEKDYFIVRIQFEKEYKRKHSLREINLLEKHCH